MTDDTDIDGFFSTARVSGRDEAVTLDSDSYRAYVYPPDDEELAPWRGMSYEEFTAARQENEFLRQLLADWDALYDEPFVGITTDGTPRTDAWPLPAEGVVDSALAAAAVDALETLTADQRDSVQYPIDAPDWRGWSNPEFVFHRNGLRLEDLADAQVEAILRLVEASLSPEGYGRVREAMELNGFLGEVTELPTIMNDRSYWFSLFGTPSTDDPWGWQLFGHHVAVNFVTVAGRDVVAPIFLGAEPALSDGARPPLFDARERRALELAGSLTDAQRSEAVVFESVLDPSMPEGRLHPADERHVAGAFRDNRVVPYEGIPAARLDTHQRDLLRQIVADFLGLLREPHRALALERYDACIDETWFSWYGATDGTQPVYFRIQSPVIIAELDNHAGVWLSNRLPARFHVHTTLRLPNGNDYGRAWVEAWKALTRG
ncbi:DUF3500 domain-containing protein [Leifsonia sp. Leaf264]|uniref:DUF3500 domain-containing protein n=1 Tax=Leifsonia sp. Leaf264 TaxID=1736314 RepID=UPI0006FEFDAE|nr:DUF3500 domain-containing protein [Leifsonia sp. Leaf264]KQP01813.1 hypothetical protein ASF30_04375 [Leifsonia sp. Leaf264]